MTRSLPKRPNAPNWLPSKRGWVFILYAAWITAWVAVAWCCEPLIADGLAHMAGRGL